MTVLRQKREKPHKPAGISSIQRTPRRHYIWLLTQQITSIAKPFRENVTAIVLFYSGKTSKAIFDDYAGELSQEEYKKYLAQLKIQKFSHIVFNFRHPYGIQTGCQLDWKSYLIDHGWRTRCTRCRPELTGSEPDSPKQGEKLALLVSTGKCKVAIGMQLSHDQVKHLSEEDVKKYCKRYETYAGTTTTESLIQSFWCFSPRELGCLWALMMWS